MNEELKVFESPESKVLLDAIVSLANKSEARRFLRDLLTATEIEEFSNRFKAAQMLYDGIPYTQISEVTGLSSTTVARISKWLSSGAGGYEFMIKRLAKD